MWSYAMQTRAVLCTVWMGLRSLCTIRADKTLRTSYAGATQYVDDAMYWLIYIFSDLSLMSLDKKFEQAGIATMAEINTGWWCCPPVHEYWCSLIFMHRSTLALLSHLMSFHFLHWISEILIMPIACNLLWSTALGWSSKCCFALTLALMEYLSSTVLCLYFIVHVLKLIYLYVIVVLYFSFLVYICIMFRYVDVPCITQSCPVQSWNWYCSCTCMQSMSYDHEAKCRLIV